MNISVADLVVSVATAADAPGMVEVIRAAFGARPPLDPPSTADQETAQTVAAAIADGGGIYATVGGRPAGALLIKAAGPGLANFTRVSVNPAYQRHGIASTMVALAQDFAAELGFAAVELYAREEFGELITYWRHRGYQVIRLADHGVILGRPLPVVVRVPTADTMRDLGERLARLLRAGDLIIASGELGAGKTTLTQGIGAGLGAAGQVISPTFVLSRVHHSGTGRPSLVHVDAYRLNGSDELDDLALEDSASEHGSVTVVEWGTGIAEHLAGSRLEIDINRGSPDRDAGLRTVVLRGVGDRWGPSELTQLAALASPAEPR